MKTTVTLLTALLLVAEKYPEIAATIGDYLPSDRFGSIDWQPI